MAVDGRKLVDPATLDEACAPRRIERSQPVATADAAVN
jgi:hypothetical protein